MYYEQMFELLRVPLRQAWLDDVGFRGNLVRREGDTLVHVDGGPLDAPGTPIRNALREEAYGSANWVVRLRLTPNSVFRDVTDTELTVPWFRTETSWVAVAPAVVDLEDPVFRAGPLPEEIVTEATHLSFYADQGEEILRLSGDGELYWRGRFVETDRDLVMGLRDLLSSLQPGQTGQPVQIELPFVGPRLTEWERLRDGADD